MLVAVISPYHLTTRDVPALAALLLCDRAVTFVPSPRAEKREDLTRAAHAAPSFRAVMESWRWSVPVWEDNVLSADAGGDAPDCDVHDALRMIERDAGLVPLRAVMRTQLFGGDAEALDVIAADVLKGGPDPGVSVPVAAGLDRFAARHGAIVARGAAASFAQHAEEQLAVPITSIAIPVLTQADGEYIVRARDILEPALRPLRRAISDGDRAGPIADAASAYAAAFDAERANIVEPIDLDDPRVVDSFVTILLAKIPVDAVLRSGARAAGVIGVRPPRSVGAPVDAIVERDPLAGAVCRTMMIRALGKRR